jgi:hypothetical protein
VITAMRAFMNFGAFLCAWCLLATFPAGCNEPPRRTEADILSELEKERAAGRSDAALKLARELTNKHDGTPEAAKAAEQIPELERAVKIAEKAERARAAQAAAVAEAQRLANKWTYQIDEDLMTSRKAKFATIKSENTVNFSVPYQGPQHGTLTLREHPRYGQDVIFSIDRGQLLCRSYSDCEIRIRFDEGNPERWNAIGPEDNSTTHIFLRNESRFVQKLRVAKVVRLQISALFEKYVIR